MGLTTAARRRRIPQPPFSVLDSDSLFYYVHPLCKLCFQYHLSKQIIGLRMQYYSKWWGVVFEIKNHAVKISQLGPGFKALLPSLYKGKVGLDVVEAQHLMDGLDWQGAVKDIEASVNWLKANGSKKACYH
ncbi:hypothetical protein AHAS_Ahas02G0147500 [Arachis hypogaea]